MSSVNRRSLISFSFWNYFSNNFNVVLYYFACLIAVLKGDSMPALISFDLASLAV